MTARHRATVAEADLLVEDGEGLVLVGESLLRLGPLAIELIRAGARPRTLAELVDHCVDVWGPVPDGDATPHVEAALAHLIDAGLVVVEEDA